MGYLIKNYYQKSYCILYPFLELRREKFVENVHLQNTYLSWSETNESIENGCLILKYDDIEDTNFKNYENKVLLKNKYLSNIYDFDSSRIFIFNLLHIQKLVNKFLNGKYSQFLENEKGQILGYWNAPNPKKKTMGNEYHMVLYPEYYFEAVAEELGIQEEYLRSVGELWEKPDMDKEHLVMKNELQLNLNL